MYGQKIENSSIVQKLAEVLGKIDINLTSDYFALSPEDQVRILESLQSYNNKQSSSEETMMQFLEYRIHKSIGLYWPPFFLVLGTLGNVLSFLILRNKAMTRQSTNLFLAALAVSDSIVLFVGLFRRWIEDILKIEVQAESKWLCKSVAVLGYSSSHFSVWLIIAVTIERYIVVSHPLRASWFCNLKRARRIIALLAITFLSINMHFMWTMTLKDKQKGSACEPLPECKFLVITVWIWIDAALYALVPFVVIVVFNMLIIQQTIRATTWRGAAQKGPLINMEKRNVSKDNNIKLTVMLLSVSFTFLMTTFPMAIVMVIQQQWKRNEQEQNISVLAQRQLIRTIAEMLMFLNHSVNFYLYCALGQKFRNQVIKTLFGRTLSKKALVLDHSQHLYCSRVNGYHVHKSSETAL